MRGFRLAGSPSFVFGTRIFAPPARAAFPAVDLDERQAEDVRVGRAIEVELAALSAVFGPDGAFLALYEPRDGRARPVAVFV